MCIRDRPTSGQLIKQINDAIERRANQSLRQNDLTMVQIWVLMSLSEKEDKTYSLKELERILGVAQSTCAGIVNRLSVKNLVDCFTDPADKRMKLVRILSLIHIFRSPPMSDIRRRCGKTADALPSSRVSSRIGRKLRRHCWDRTLSSGVWAFP